MMSMRSFADSDETKREPTTDPPHLDENSAYLECGCRLPSRQAGRSFLGAQPNAVRDEQLLPKDLVQVGGCEIAVLQCRR